MSIETKKILHVFGKMDRGGAETWIVNVLKIIDKKSYNFDFLVHKDSRGDYDEEILKFGCKILYCANYKNPFKYFLNLKRLIELNGPYDIIHSHVHHYSGFVIFFAHILKIPMKIVHSHNDTLHIQKRAKILKKCYYFLTYLLIKKYSTIGIACSEKAAVSLFGSNWNSYSKFILQYTGIDVTKFKINIDKSEFRIKNGLPKEGYIIGHVGNFHKQKNHKFLIDVFKEVNEFDKNTYLLLIGEGHLKEYIYSLIEEYNLNDYVFFTGTISNVNEFMIAAMDIFLLPSLYEGLPLVGMEAQAAGLNCLFSENISEEIIIYPPIAKRLPIYRGVWPWKNEILKVKSNIKESFHKIKALEIVENSPFNVIKSVNIITKIYSELKL